MRLQGPLTQSHVDDGRAGDSGQDSAMGGRQLEGGHLELPQRTFCTCRAVYCWMHWNANYTDERSQVKCGTISHGSGGAAATLAPSTESHQAVDQLGSVSFRARPRPAQWSWAADGGRAVWPAPLPLPAAGAPLRPSGACPIIREK